MRSGFLFVVHQPVLTQLGFVIVDGSQSTAQEPTGGIAHGDGNDFIPDAAHYKQVCLSEGHKRGQHDDHGCLAVAGTPKRTGVNLVEAA